MFFFKQKTAYEMRISDWISDVCSSDLALGLAVGSAVIDPDMHVGVDRPGLGDQVGQRLAEMALLRREAILLVDFQMGLDGARAARIGAYIDRKSTRLNSSH